MSFSIFSVIGFVILVYVEGTIKTRDCYDCMPYINCTLAKYRADTDKSNDTLKVFKHAFCGLHNSTIVKVCCSDFDVPDFSTRWQREEIHPNLRLLSDSCGKVAPNRILGGVVATLYEFPWMALIAYGDENNFECSGTLISPRYVLTAAHCVVNKDIRGVRIGDYDLSTTIDCEGYACENRTQDREVAYDIVHEDYETTSYSNDIALLRLKTPVEIPLKNADVICLPTTTELQKKTIVNKLGTVAGWGLTEYGRLSHRLRKVDIPVRSINNCQEYYSHIPDRNPTQFCAGVQKKDSCRGDSGGPLMIETMIEDESKVVQYGIVSNGPDRCGTDFPGIYTDVRKYMKWILDNIKQ